jgi:hypothetical protein
MVYDIDIHELNLRPFIDLNILDEFSFLKCVFFSLWNNKHTHTQIYIYREKPLPYQRGEDFIDGHRIIFSIFFCLVMFHEPQT